MRSPKFALTFAFALAALIGLSAVSTVEAKPKKNKEPAAAASHDGTVVTAGAGKISVKDDGGKSSSYSVDSKTDITVDGKKGKIDDIKAGMKVTVTATGDKATKVVATKA